MIGVCSLNGEPHDSPISEWEREHYLHELTLAEHAARARKLENKLLTQGVGELMRNLSAQISPGTESESLYKGLLSYSPNQAEIFYGWNEAKKELLNTMKQGYGQLGVASTGRDNHHLNVITL